MNRSKHHPHPPGVPRRRASRRLFFAASTLVLAFPILALASPLDIPNEFSAGGIISAEAFNENFGLVADAVNDNDARITALEAEAGLPSGIIAFFESDVCPDGWSEVVAMRGRVPLGLPNPGTVGHTQGTELEDQGTRTVSQVPNHTHGVGTLSANASSVAPQHTVSGSGTHSHAIEVGGAHDHSIRVEAFGNYSTFAVSGVANAGSSALTANPIATNGSEHTHTIAPGGGGHSHSVSSTAHSHSISMAGNTGNNAGGVGSVDVTMPYMQLLACSKD